MQTFSVYNTGAVNKPGVPSNNRILLNIVTMSLTHITEKVCVMREEEEDSVTMTVESSTNTCAKPDTKSNFNPNYSTRQCTFLNHSI